MATHGQSGSLPDGGLESLPLAKLLQGWLPGEPVLGFLLSWEFPRNVQTYTERSLLMHPTLQGGGGALGELLATTLYPDAILGLNWLSEAVSAE